MIAGDNLSPSSAAFLLYLLGRQQLSVGAPDFDAVVDILRQARAELAAIIEADKPA